MQFFVLKYIKVNLSPVYAMRAYRGSRDMTPLILNLNTSC